MDIIISSVYIISRSNVLKALGLNIINKTCPKGNSWKHLLVKWNANTVLLRIVCIHVTSCNCMGKTKSWKTLLPWVRVTQQQLQCSFRQEYDGEQSEPIGTKMTTQDQDEKRYDPRDTTLKFVTRPDDLDPFRKYNCIRHAGWGEFMFVLFNTWIFIDCSDSYKRSIYSN